MNSDFEILKRQWAEQSARLDKLEAQNEKLLQMLSTSSNLTLRDKLIRDYKVFFVIGLIFIPITLCMFPSFDFPWSLTTIFASIFAIETIGNGYILKLLYRLDFANITTHEALKRVIHLKRMRNILQFSCCALIIPVLVYAFYIFGTIDSSILWGGITGGVVGGIIGLLKDRPIRQTIKRLKSELEQFS